jgi:hypothetical protein
MRPPPGSSRYLDSVVVVFLFAVFLFVPPVFDRWAAPDASWYLPYLVWLGIIAVTWLIQWLRDRREL